MGTIKRRDGVVETDIASDVTIAVLREIVDGYRNAGGGRIWLCRAANAKTYEDGATSFAAEAFTSLMHTHGLEIVIAVLGSATVRMGARVVALRAKFDLRIASSDAEAEALVRSIASPAPEVKSG